MRRFRPGRPLKRHRSTKKDGLLLRRRKLRIIPELMYQFACSGTGKLRSLMFCMIVAATRVRRGRNVEPCPPEKREAIEEALRHFGVIS